MPKGIIRLLAVAALAALLIAVASAGAQDAKPVACGPTIKDPADDQSAPAEGNTPSTEIIGGFALHDPAKGPAATTFNLVLKEFKAEVKAGATSMGWATFMDQEDGTRRFVRAILDFSGAVAYEYGTFVPNPAFPTVPLTGVSRYDGDTTGKLIEGPEGVVQIVVPADIAKPGATLNGMYSNATQGRTAPSETPGGQRGLSSVLDVAPDEAPTTPSTYNFKVQPCPEGSQPPADGGGTTPPPGGGGGGGGGGGTTPPPSGGTTPPPPSGPATLPIKVAGKVKAPKRKTLAVKLSSTETITSLAAQVRKGKKVVGRGKMARLARKGTLKLRLSRKLRKGKYTLDLAGNRENGQRGVSSLSLRLR